MPKTTKKTLHRSSKSGKIVTKKFAEENPDTTEKEVIKTHIHSLEAEFGREDLNKIVHKINEICVYLNSKI